MLFDHWVYFGHVFKSDPLGLGFCLWFFLYWKLCFLDDMTWNSAVFCWQINIYILYAYWISVLHYPAIIHLNVRLNLKWNLRKQSPCRVLKKRYSQIFKTLSKTPAAESFLMKWQTTNLQLCWKEISEFSIIFLDTNFIETTSTKACKFCMVCIN